jgi:hypothetical protein
MKELITLDQANRLMLALLIAAPVIGLIVGLVRKRASSGFLIGLGIGIANYALWTMYSALTGRLGLDTVKNLVLNLALFVVFGVLVGSCIAWYQTSQMDKTK